MAAPFEQLATNITVGRGLVIHPDDVPESPFELDLNTRILLGLRLPYPLSRNNPDEWEDLGGKEEPDKGDATTCDAAQREIQEEGGVRTAVLSAPFRSALKLVDRPLEDRGYGPSNGRYQVDVYPMRALDYRLTPFPAEHQAIGWFSIRTAVQELKLSRETQKTLLLPRLVGFQVVNFASEHLLAA